MSYSYFSASQNDAVALRRYLRVVTEGLSLITFPATIGIALVAHDFVYLVVGAKWQSAVVPLEILGFYASFRCIVTLLPSILNVTGESRVNMQYSLFALILMPTAFYFGSRWGPEGIAYGYGDCLSGSCPHSLPVSTRSGKSRCHGAAIWGRCRPAFTQVP